MKSKSTIWILEDDQDIQFVYDEILGIRFVLRFFSSVDSFILALTEKLDTPDLVVADLRLSDCSFVDFLGGAHRKLLGVPYIVVSSVDDVDVLRFCFGHGASDYLIKPFQRTELIVKIERALGRLPMRLGSLAKGELPEVLQDCLTATERKIFRLFFRDGTASASREDIVKTVWGDTRVDPKAVDVHLYNLRRKIEPLGYSIQYSSNQNWVLKTPNT